MNNSEVKIDINEVKRNHLISENPHYLIDEIENGVASCTHIESGKSGIGIDMSYIGSFTRTADQFHKVVKVGKEDKYWTQKQIDEAVKKGDLKKDHKVSVGDVRLKGIRTIWEEIYSSQCLTVCFIKQGSKLPAKEYEALLEKQREHASDLIEKAKKNKKSMKDAYEAGLAYIQQNPISEFKEGDLRTLRGWKVQFTSRDGRYDCIDIDLPEDDNAKRIRPVNINTIMWLIFDGVKYEVE